MAKEFLEKFAGGTSMHGVPKAIQARSASTKLFWSVICLSAACMFAFQFAQLIQRYYSYPKKVIVDVLPTDVPFPSVSLCNIRNLDIMVLNKLNRIFRNMTEQLTWTNITDEDPFIKAYLETVAKYRPMFNRRDLDVSVFQTVLSRTMIATSINRSLVINAGVSFEELIATCKFAGQACNNTESWSHFFDPLFYNCFTFKAPRSVGDGAALAEGPENGWSTTVMAGNGMLDQNEELRMIPGLHEGTSSSTSSEGVRVVIHPPDTKPYPHTEGFDVPPGFSANFGVKIRLTLRIGPPHGNCTDEDPHGRDGPGSYKRISCQKKCLQAEIVKVCKCKDISLPDHENYPDARFCTEDADIPDACRFDGLDLCVDMLRRVHDRFHCVWDTTSRMMKSPGFNKICQCNPPCEEVSYDTTYSLSKWPAKSFYGEDQAYIEMFIIDAYTDRFRKWQEKYLFYEKYFNPSNRRRAMRDFARLNVFIADSNLVKTEEIEDYSVSQLLSDIGGQLGLWVGISVITLAEVLELISDVIRWACSTQRNTPPGGVYHTG